jgi:hypothetical protein
MTFSLEFIGNPPEAHQGIPRHQRRTPEERADQGSCTKEKRKAGRDRSKSPDSSQDSCRQGRATIES